MKNGMMTVVCRKPGELALEERPLPERGAGRGAARHPPHRHLRHRLSHLRGAAPVPAISAHHGPRAFGRGAGSAEGKQRSGRAIRSSSSPISPAEPASPAAAARRIAARRCNASASIATAAWPSASRCRRRTSIRPRGFRSTRRRWSSSSPSARMPCAARASRPGTARLSSAPGPIGIGTALFARLAGAEVTLMDRVPADPRPRGPHHRHRLDHPCRRRTPPSGSPTLTGGENVRRGVRRDRQRRAPWRRASTMPRAAAPMCWSAW